jgi:hypothetical protein
MQTRQVYPAGFNPLISDFLGVTKAKEHIKCYRINPLTTQRSFMHFFCYDRTQNDTERFFG